MTDIKKDPCCDHIHSLSLLRNQASNLNLQPAYVSFLDNVLLQCIRFDNQADIVTYYDTIYDELISRRNIAIDLFKSSIVDNITIPDKSPV